MIKTALDLIRAGETINAQAYKIDREVKTSVSVVKNNGENADLGQRRKKVSR